MEGVDHEFGGAWTEVKLDAISEYLAFYTTALKAKPSPTTPFSTWYVDAFAGTGDRVACPASTDIFGANRAVVHAGSAMRALGVSPAFSHFVFIENDPTRFESLDRLKARYPTRDIRTLCGDANDMIVRAFSDPAWKAPGERTLQRALVFLDPYGMEVEWSTLRFLAETRRADVWYLFPLHTTQRQLTRDHSLLDDRRKASLARVFGTDDWEDEFYRPQPNGGDLFGNVAPPLRSADARDVERFAKRRLESIFAYVSDPIPLFRRNTTLFSLFLLTGNPDRKAVDLIRRGVDHVVGKYGSGSVSRQ